MRVLFTSSQGLNFFHSGYRILLSKLKVTSCSVPRMCSNHNEENYGAAVEALNSLQSNAAVLEKARLQKDRQAVFNVRNTEKYLNRLGISLDMIDKQLKIIHVSGTKGKGSTCAFCESILKYHGLKTGFYSSPHLVEVRERIRINGTPLTKQEFSNYFWKVYIPLKTQMDHENDMPAYFKFMTVMALYVFLKEGVDVAVIEVGIGGLHDCTNVIRKPTVVGISSLGLDHVSLLGDTVEKIAVHKAGIMKPSVPTFTVSDQPGESLEVLTRKASEIKCPLFIVPPLDAYQWNPYQLKLGLSGPVQWKNASLALQLTRAFLRIQNTDGFQQSSQNCDSPEVALPFQIHLSDALGLARAVWPGRSQILRLSGATYYVDGAHTPESIEACVDWFLRAIDVPSDIKRKRVLVFNTTGDRNTELLLGLLKECSFDMALFCSNIVEATESTPKDLTNLMVTTEQQISRSKANKDAWTRINPRSSVLLDEHSLSFSSINRALQYISEYVVVNNQEVDVLVTGSLHLVGGVLSLLDPELSFLGSEKDHQSKGSYVPLTAHCNGCLVVPGTP